LLLACDGANQLSPPPGPTSSGGAVSGTSSGEAGAGAQGAGGGSGGESGSVYGIDCPPSAPSSVPADSPRILILGTEAWSPPAIAAHLQAILAADSAFTAPTVTGLTTAAHTPAGYPEGGESLMNFFYLTEGRDERLAPLAEPWSYVVVLESPGFVSAFPEFHFEGVRVLGCSARAAGAEPIVLMPWTAAPAPSAAALGEITYRVANGTNSIVAPAGFAWEEAQAVASPALGQNDRFVAAATLYSTLTGRDAGATGYDPTEIPPDLAAELATIAFNAVQSEAGRVHYQGAYHGVVEMRTAAPGGDFWFMESGTSSEQIWYDRMGEIVPKAGLVPQGTQIGYTNPNKSFDAACLDNALPYFRQQQYQTLFARGYEADPNCPCTDDDTQCPESMCAATITAAGMQTDLQVQVWDRHIDSVLSDGRGAINMMEERLKDTYRQANALGLALIPYHLMFAKLRTMRPSVQLLSDGIHATYPVGYGLATMSFVSRTGIHAPTDGLDADTQLAAELAEETIRQLSTLSVSGAFVPDDPSRR
jgi:hypothetical protein